MCFVHPFTVHGNNMATCADDLVKFGTTMSTTEPVLGEGGEGRGVEQRKLGYINSLFTFCFAGNSFVKFGTLLNVRR